MQDREQQIYVSIDLKTYHMTARELVTNVIHNIYKKQE